MPNLQIYKLAFFSTILIFAVEATALDIAGFASIKLGKTNRADVPVLEYNDHWSGRTDSIFGIQLYDNIADDVSVTAQIVAHGLEQNGRDAFEPTIDWLFLSYQHSATTRFRLGRMRYPLFMYSETMAIGYSYSWVRPPIDVYDPYLMIFSNYEGMDVTVSRALYGKEFEWNFYIGVLEGERSEVTMESGLTYGSSITMRDDNLTLRYGITINRVTQDVSWISLLNNAFNNFAPLNPIFSEITESTQIVDEWYQYHSLAMQYDRGDWTYQTELNAIIAPDDGLTADKLGWYLSISRQIDSVRPYVVLGYSEYDLANDETVDLIRQSETIIPPGFSLPLDGLRNATVENFRDINNSGVSGTVGFRYDFHRQMALKVEFQYFNASTPVVDRTPESGDKDLHWTTVALEMVF